MKTPVLKSEGQKNARFIYQTEIIGCNRSAKKIFEILLWKMSYRLEQRTDLIMYDENRNIRIGITDFLIKKIET